MIAPLNIHRMSLITLDQTLNHLIRRRPPIINITHNVKMIDRQPLNCPTRRLNPLIGLLQNNQVANNLPIISQLIRRVRIVIQQLFGNINKLRRHRLTHFRTGIFSRGKRQQANQPAKSGQIPLLQIIPLQLLMNRSQPFRRVIHQKSKPLQSRLGHLIPKT